jgi:hypothetical protein
MNLKFAMVAAASLGALMLGAAPSVANDAGTAAKATATYEKGYETTQARGRGGRGGGGFVARGGGRRNNTGRNVAIGAGALILGGIIASQAASAGGGNSCGRWNYRCNRGDGFACRQLNRYC